MSTDFQYRYISGENLILDLSSSDKTGDTIGEASAINSSGSTSSDQDSNDNEKRCSDANRRKSRRENHMDSNSGLYWNVGLPPAKKLTMDSIPEDELPVPKLKELVLGSDSEAINRIAKLSIKDDDKPLAGVVASVATFVGLIMVKPLMPRDFLLYYGSPLFVRTSNAYSVSKEVAVGPIINMLGPVSEPYYCVELVRNGNELVSMGTQVFYSPVDPRTRYIPLKREYDNRFTASSKGNPYTEYFRHSGSTERFPHLQRRRRRSAGIRGFSDYRSTYSGILHSIRPKHSHFSH
ncbi:H/ACA ribonucleoprotein complex non-core subunit NAF1-like isoform X1 [Neodiprion pinetum]|uniref:H/ACA ribonucleoprotein complex non-core subunit NAF1-like isoform X1 n=1 Tax=Neodiprion pinetum TaxID=441929 RepID=UPI001EDDABAD|nr:uncharacterized protein LOC124224403 isoform X1 [Neodiprion pinetum]XP_046492548.1 uncharacterized protein LOC124224403 isoform X1 [Neodiprion pinetum]XP_046492549.1 uncharacterized protein LOC124224403 isoform X1 [Neodiprion pinetum]